MNYSPRKFTPPHQDLIFIFQQNYPIKNLFFPSLSELCVSIFSTKQYLEVANNIKLILIKPKSIEIFFLKPDFLFLLRVISQGLLNSPRQRLPETPWDNQAALTPLINLCLSNSDFSISLPFCVKICSPLICKKESEIKKSNNKPASFVFCIDSWDHKTIKQWLALVLTLGLGTRRVQPQ